MPKGTVTLVTSRPDEVIALHTIAPFPSMTTIPDKTGFRKVVEYADKRILAAKEKNKAHNAQDKAADKCHGTGGPSRRAKKKKTAPISLALFDFKEVGSCLSGFDTIHSVSPLTTIAPLN
ncbi:hypothetical protein Tco_0633041 [Tanacetum coccineum]